MRTLAHRMVDDALTYLETVHERPVWQPVPEEVAARFEGQRPAPGGGVAVYQEFFETILPYPMGNIHRVSGAGIWVMERFLARWPILWPRS